MDNVGKDYVWGVAMRDYIFNTDILKEAWRKV